MSDAKVSIKFTNDLGAEITVHLDGEAQINDTLSYYGNKGWYSGSVPAGGFILPYDNEHDFNWALIGARPFVNADGEPCVWCRGHVYKRRDLEAVESKKFKLPKAVKYSRGAKATDPANIREPSDGEIEYVTLIIFRGGQRQDRYAAKR